MAKSARFSDVPASGSPTLICYERLAPTEREQTLLTPAHDHMLALVAEFYSAWPSGAATDSTSDRLERQSRLQSFMTLYCTLEQDLVGLDPLESLPMDIASWLYGGCLGSSPFFPRPSDPSAPQRWDLPIARALSSFLDFFSNSDTD
jgi:hypothetical protein